MANAFLGIPLPYTIGATSAISAGDKNNLLNDEPGLIAQADTASGAAFQIFVDLTDDTVSVGAVCVLGLTKSDYSIEAWGYPTATDRDNGTNRSFASGLTSILFSTNRSATLVKALITFATPRTEKYWRVRLINNVVATRTQGPWRLLMLETIQPATNIEVNPSVTVDDRSERRYTRAGGRVIDPTVICPAFQGQWPWITASEAHRIRSRLLYTRAGSYPALFVLDPADTTWGEDFIFYGDFEKSLSLDLDNDDLNTFKFAIVSIAP